MCQTDLIIFLTWCIVQKFLYGQVQKLAMEVLQKNAYFAHPENLVLGMLCDDERVHRIAVNKIQCIRKKCQIIVSR